MCYKEDKSAFIYFYCVANGITYNHLHTRLILRRKANSIGHILRRICLLHDAIEGKMTEVKGV